MGGKLRLAAAAALFSGLLSAGPQFEVASIRTGLPFSMDLLRSGGIGMKITGTRVLIRSWSLADLIGAAYQVRVDQISGPSWMGAQRFDVQATMPEGSTAEQVPEMLQALLADRFKMIARRTEKTMSVYAITVGKGKPKLQEPAPDDPSPSGCVTVSGGHRVCHKMTMQDLATFLTSVYRMYVAMPPGAMTWGVDLPVVDQTGLKGAYDFTMDFGPDNLENSGPAMDAVEKLGLKLEAQKQPSVQIVIDRLEKMPTEN